MKAKIVLLFGLIMFLTSTAIAQPSSGGMFLGGTLNFSIDSFKRVDGSTTTDGPSTTNFELMPTGGFFISENMAFGAGIGLSVNSTKETWDGVDEVDTETMFHLVPFIRYYMGSANAGLYAQAEFGVGFGGSTFTEGNVSTDGPDLFNLDIGVRPGFYYYVTPNLSLEAQMGFIGLKREQGTIQRPDNTERKDIDSTFGLSFTPANLRFGLVYHL